MSRPAGYLSVNCHLPAPFFRARLTGVVLLSIFFSPLLIAQQAPQRDSSAIALLSQAISVAGGTQLGLIQDFIASGNITHYWNNTSQQGQVTIKSRGSLQFRLDSQLSQGTWSLIATNGVGEVALPSGEITQIAYHNCINAGSLTWPILKVNTALQDQTTTILDMGAVQIGSHQAHQVRVIQNLQSDPTGIFSKLTTRDYFFDPSSFFLVRVQDSLHPNNDAVNGALTHTINLGSYQAVNGALVPFSISESVAGQQTWQIQLSSINFNTGLSDSDFQF